MSKEHLARPIRRMASDEQGAALVLALVLLAIALLLMGPLLSFVGMGLKTTAEVYDRKALELYAADSGVEDAIGRISAGNDLPLVIGETKESFAPITVNGRNVSYTITMISTTNYPQAREAYRIVSTAASDADRRTTITSDYIILPAGLDMTYLTEIPIAYNASAYATLSPASVSAVALTNDGEGYTSPPTATISGGGGSGAAATVTLAGTYVADLVLASPGSGYESAPAVVIDAPSNGGTQAAASATLGFAVAGLTLDSPGSGYTSSPEVSISGDGSGALAEAVLAPRGVQDVALTAGGAGYTTAPTVSIVGGDGSGAAAEAQLTPTGVSTIAVTGGGSGYTSVPSVIISGGGGVGVEAVATLSPTGEVTGITITNGGSGYTSPPAVSISAPAEPGTGATATATLAPTSVASVTLTNGGSGYTSVPSVEFGGGGGSGAAAIANLEPASITSLVLIDGGSGYTIAPAVTIGPPNIGGIQATAYATLAPLGSVKSITLTGGGSNYTSVPGVTISGGGGTGATAAGELAPTYVASITLTDGGSGYTSSPDVSISGGGGTGATAVATISSHVASVTVTDGGSGYSSAPSVSFSGGGGWGAAAAAIISDDGTVASVTVTDGGAGYAFAPAVSFSGGFADTATTWPGADEVTAFYLNQVQGLTPISGGTINLTDPQFQGPLYIQGDVIFTTNSNKDPTVVTLPEAPTDQKIIYVEGEVKFTNCNLNLNGYTVFSTSTGSDYAIQIQPSSNMGGPGSFIGVGAVSFQPNLTNEEYIFVASLEDEVVLHPNGEFVGSVAAYATVRQPSQGNSSTETSWTDPPVLNIPDGTGGTPGIMTWIIR